MKNQEIIKIKIQNEFPDTHYLIYRNKQYPIKFDYFKIASKFFTNNQEEIERTKNIQIEDSEENSKINIDEQSIYDFINFIQHQEISINNDNVIGLHYLSKRFEVEQLKEASRSYIEQNQQEIALKIFIQHQNDEKFDNQIYEEIISSNLNKFIKDKQFEYINISNLYRIFEKYSTRKNDQKNIEMQQMINEFLLKKICKGGRETSPLLTFMKFDESNQKMLKKLLIEYSSVLDFSYINSTVIQLYLKNSEEQERKEKENRNKVDELKQMMDDKIKSIEADHLIQIEELKRKIEIIKKEEEKNMKIKQNEIEKIALEMKNQKDEFEKFMKEKENIIDQITKENKELNNQANNIKIESKYSILSFNHKEGKELDGIFNYLTKKTGGNIHDNKTIEVTTDSYNSSYPPKNLIDLNEKKSYVTNGHNKKISIIFDFKNMEIEIAKYSIKSFSYDQNKAHVKNWVIEISNDCKNWKTIDEHTNSSELNGSSIIKTFDVTQKIFSRYCRFRHTGDYWGIEDGWVIEFANIEFYGRLIIPMFK